MILQHDLENDVYPHYLIQDRKVCRCHGIECISLKFYHQDEQSRLLNIESPDLENFSLGVFELVSSGTQEINERDYFYEEYKANGFKMKNPRRVPMGFNPRMVPPKPAK